MSAGAVRVPELGRLGEPLQGEHILFVDEGELTSVLRRWSRRTCLQKKVSGSVVMWGRR